MLIHGFSLVNARLLKAFGTAFYAITFIKFGRFCLFLTSENSVICTVTLRHLSQFWRVMGVITLARHGRYNVRKELFLRLKGIFSLGKIPVLIIFEENKNDSFPREIQTTGISEYSNYWSQKFYFEISVVLDQST